MSDEYGFICPSLNSPLIGKVVKYDRNNGFYLLQMPEKKRNGDYQFYYCNVDLHKFVGKWVEVEVVDYTMYGRNEEIRALNKNELKKRCLIYE